MMRSSTSLFILLVATAMAQDLNVGITENCTGVGLFDYCCPGSLIGTNGNLNSAADGICCVGDPNQSIDSTPGSSCTAGTPVPLTAISAYIATAGTATTSIISATSNSASTESTSGLTTTTTSESTSRTRSTSSTGTATAESSSTSTAAAALVTTAPWTGVALGAVGFVIAAL